MLSCVHITHIVIYQCNLICLCCNFFFLFTFYCWKSFSILCLNHLNFCRAWQIFLVVLVVYTAWVSPFEFGFLEKPATPLAIFDNIVNGFFAIDIILTFFVAFLDKNTYLLVDDRRLIAFRYARTWLLFDVISSIPSELARKVLPNPFRKYGLFNMLRLWRLRRVGALFAR